ncbi:MAG: glycosyltransferase family 4 protein [Nitrospira sp.]|nr:glycosyltransferase family 4 protein [Nitrospira sp.]
MKILFVANEVPFPPDNGVRIPIFHAMRLMSQAGHEIALAVLTAETCEVIDRFSRITAKFCSGGSLLERIPWRHPLAVQLAAILGQRLLFVEKYRSAVFREKLVELISKFQPDVIHFDLIPMVQYLSAAPAGVGTVASINDSYALTLENALHAGYFKGLEYIYKKWQYYGTLNYEASAYQQFDQIQVMSETDKNYLLKLNPHLRVSVIPNGAEDTLFHLTASTSSNSDIIFVATLTGTHLKGLQRFLSQSWPIVKKHYPSVRLNVVGKIGPDAGKLMEEYSGFPEVKFTGYIPDLADVYRMGGIAIAPIDQNCGIVNKVIEAMAAGLAVVGFKNTFSGIPQGKPGVHFLQVVNYDSMGHEIVQLLGNEKRCNEIKVAAQGLARSYYSWSSRGDLYNQMYTNAMKSAGRS